MPAATSSRTVIARSSLLSAIAVLWYENLQKEKRIVWTREATGLVREISPLVAILGTIAVTIGAGWQKRVFQVAGWAPVPENTFPFGIPPVVMAFLETAVPVIIAFLALGYLAAVMPRAGGGYVAMTRITHPLLGFVVTWLEYAWWWFAYGVIASLVMENLLMFVGLVGGPAAMAPYLTPWVLGAFGISMIVVFSLLSTFGVRWFGWLMHVIVWTPSIIVLIIFGMFLTATPAALNTGTLFYLGHSPIEYTEAALAQGMATAFPGNYWDSVNVAMIGAAWAWTGFAGMTFASGEIKEASKKMLKVMIASGVILLLFYIFISWAMGRTAMLTGTVSVPGVGDYSFLTAWGYLSYGGGNLAKAGLPGIKAWLPLLSVLVAQGEGLVLLVPFVGVVGALWLFNDLPVMALASSRLLFAMSFDGMLPKTFSDVSEKWHTPIKAIWFTTLLAVLGVYTESGLYQKGYLYLGSFLYPIFDTGLTSGDLWDFIFFTFVCLTLALLPYTRKDIFETAPVFKSKIAGVPWITVLGSIGFITNLYIDWTFFMAPVGGLLAQGPTPVVFTILLALIAVLFYFYYRWRARVTGRDYKTIFTQLPPE